MAAELTENGLVAETALEVFTDLGAAVQASTGRSDLNVSTRSAFGRLYWPVAERLADAQALLSALLFSFDPETQGGALLAVTAFLRGTEPLPASSSTFSVRLIGTSTTDVSGRLISEGGNLWSVPPGTVIGPAGYVEVEVEAVETGPVTASPAGPWSIVTPLTGFASVVGLEQTSIGEDAETDPELRARLEASLSQALGTEPAVYSAIAQVPGVDGGTLRVDVNREDTTDAGTGMPAHSVEVLVEGGTDAAVAEALLRAASTVARTWGNTEVTVTLEEDGRQRTVYITRPEQTRVYASIEVTTAGATTSLPADAEDTLRAALVEWGSEARPRTNLTASSAEARLVPYLPSTAFSDLEVLLSLDGVSYSTFVNPGARNYGRISDAPSGAQVTGSAAEPFTIGAGWQLDLSINGGGTQSFVFPAIGPGGTAAAVVAELASLSGATATEVDGALRITTDLTGASTSIEIENTSTGALLTALGLTVGVYSGRDSDISYTVV